MDSTGWNHEAPAPKMPAEVINSTLVVLAAVIFMGAAIFALDYCAAKFVLFLFG